MGAAGNELDEVGRDRVVGLTPAAAAPPAARSPYIQQTSEHD